MPASRLSSRAWTPGEFFEARQSAPPTERWELVDGVLLVTPSPDRRHQRIVFQLAIRLDAYVKRHRIGEVLIAPLDVRLEPKLVLQPDILFIPKGASDLYRGTAISRISLAVEILSRASAKHDRVTKRPQYQRNQVDDYWIVDPDAEAIERWTPDDERPAILTKQLVWHPVGCAEPFVFDVIAFFEEVSSLGDGSTVAN